MHFSILIRKDSLFAFMFKKREKNSQNGDYRETSDTQNGGNCNDKWKQSY